jgi:transposase
MTSVGTEVSVQETFQPGASVARIAQRYELNANQLFYWRRLYREGRLGNHSATKLLPVAITDERMVEAVRVVEATAPPPLGTIEIKLAKGNYGVDRHGDARDWAKFRY